VITTSLFCQGGEEQIGNCCDYGYYVNQLKAETNLISKRCFIQDIYMTFCSFVCPEGWSQVVHHSISNGASSRHASNPSFPSNYFSSTFSIGIRSALIPNGLCMSLPLIIRTRSIGHPFTTISSNLNQTPSHPLFFAII